MSDDPFTTAEDFESRRQGFERITGGRYRLPDLTVTPDGTLVTGTASRKGGWRRVTTVARAITDSYALSAWKIRKVVEGLALRPDFYDIACSLLATREGSDLRRDLDDVVARASLAADTDRGASEGTAVHELARARDEGARVTVRTAMHPRITAYETAMREYGLTVIPEYTERRVVVLRYGVAGTVDRILRDRDGVLWVADLKTQKRFYSWEAVAAQLAAYQMADAYWDPGTLRYVDPPRTDASTGIVVWLPAERGGCELHDVNLTLGREALAECDRVLRMRSSASGARQQWSALRVQPERTLSVVEAYARRLASVATLTEGSAVWAEITAQGLAATPELLSLAGETARRIAATTTTPDAS